MRPPSKRTEHSFISGRNTFNKIQHHTVKSFFSDKTHFKQHRRTNQPRTPSTSKKTLKHAIEPQLHPSNHSRNTLTTGTQHTSWEYALEFFLFKLTPSPSHPQLKRCYCVFEWLIWILADLKYPVSSLVGIRLDICISFCYVNSKEFLQSMINQYFSTIYSAQSF